MPKLSFVVPVYRPKLDILSKCVKSIIQQSLKDFDITFVLDGPDDIAKSAIKSLMKKSTNPHKIVEIEHGGACRARNEGFNHAKGDYVIFWDCDCIVEPHAAKAWCDILDEQPEYGFVYAGYRFLGERGCLNSEPFDPWLLRVNNYISTCFPFRRDLFPGWNESLESLQDWDFWLKIVEKGAKGKFMNGYAFATAAPDPESISGKGCLPEAWLGRVDAVRKLHGIPERETCVSSQEHQHDAIALAKYIDADYRDIPNFKPHRYKNIIQVGFSLKPDRVETHARIFSEKNVRKFIFWQPEDIYDIYNCISLIALQKYSILLNDIATQFVEDETALDMMTRAGFKVSVLPMPMFNTNELKPLPEKPRFVVDIDSGYTPILKIIDKSLPDMELEVIDGATSLNDYTGMIHFFSDRTLSNSLKRAALTGRHVISNVKGMGFVDDHAEPASFIKDLVHQIRTAAVAPPPQRVIFDKSALVEALR